MFKGCTALTEAPVLSATSLVYGCYANMFEGCTSLRVAPNLPATNLPGVYSNHTYGVYMAMFSGCTSLESAPILNATNLTKYCYKDMFAGCESLNYIKMLATDISATNCLTNWVSGVASTGTFVKKTSMSSLPSGPSGIPEGWTVQDA